MKTQTVQSWLFFGMQTVTLQGGLGMQYVGTQLFNLSCLQGNPYKETCSVVNENSGVQKNSQGFLNSPVVSHYSLWLHSYPRHRVAYPKGRQSGRQEIVPSDLGRMKGITTWLEFIVDSCGRDSVLLTQMLSVSTPTIKTKQSLFKFGLLHNKKQRMLGLLHSIRSHYSGLLGE